MEHLKEDYIAYSKAMDGIRKRGRALLSLSTALGFSLVLFSSGLEAQNVTSSPKMGATVKRRMFVDPSSTTVSHNKVRLIVGPLT